ncbi:2TM domain-containing protein [Flavobacterium aestuarii]|uniref:2TM domain-containing protein n=1 Tax=Flavobacterium aestuarii TaxID=3149227 RepID=UPI0032B4A734
METNYKEAERYYRAHKKVEEIKKFYQHLTVYLLCNPIVIVVNLMTSPEFLYFWWCILGWGIPIVLHGLKAFECAPLFNKKWEDQKIKEILKKENNIQKWE